MNLNPIKANMTELEFKHPRTGFPTKVLFSYKTPVAMIDRNELAYRTDKKRSNTTTRHINQWLKDNKFHTLSTYPQEFFDNLISEVK